MRRKPVVRDQSDTCEKVVPFHQLQGIEQGDLHGADALSPRHYRFCRDFSGNPHVRHGCGRRLPAVGLDGGESTCHGTGGAADAGDTGHPGMSVGQAGD